MDSNFPSEEASYPKTKFAFLPHIRWIPTCSRSTKNEPQRLLAGWPNLANRRLRLDRSSVILDAPRQKPIIISQRAGMGQSCEESAQIAIRLDAVCLAGFDDRIEVSAGVRTGDRVGEQPGYCHVVEGHTSEVIERKQSLSMQRDDPTSNVQSRPPTP